MTKSKLIESWKLDEESMQKGIYISKEDVTSFNMEILERRPELTKIHFDMIPQPFWGNIDNPSVIVLFTNPGFKEKEYEQERNISRVRQGLLDNINGKRFDYLEEEIYGQNRLKKWDYLNSAKYWISAFKDIETALPGIPVSSFFGEFEFHGYPSRNHKRFSYKRKKEIIDSYLPTQIKSFEHIKYLIQKNNPIIIIARAESYWLDAIPELENIDYITVNNFQAGSLNKGNMNEIDFNKVISRIKSDYKNSKNGSFRFKIETAFESLRKFEDEIVLIEEENKNSIDVVLPNEGTQYSQNTVNITDCVYQSIEKKDIKDYSLKTFFKLRDIYGEDNLFEFGDNLPIEVLYYMFLYTFESRDYYIVEASITLGYIRKLIIRFNEFLKNKHE